MYSTNKKIERRWFGSYNSYPANSRLPRESAWLKDILKGMFSLSGDFLFI